MATKPSDAEELLTGSIDDYLLALADGIHKAQRQLSQVSIELQPGQPAITYQLPKVEFEFKMSFELGRAAGGEAREGEDGKKAVLRMAPVDPRADRDSVRAEAASILRGSFVAVPALGGKAPPVVTTGVEKKPGRCYGITVDVHEETGGPLAGIEVQFNVDWDLSGRLNEAANLLGVARSQGVVILKNGVARTNREGRATNLLTVKGGDGVPPELYIAVRVDVLGETETLTFKL